MFSIRVAVIAASLATAGALSMRSSGEACDQRYPTEASIIKGYMQDSRHKVLLFGWQGCPCTGIAEARFAEHSICYEERTWAAPNSQLMAYLQCKENKPNDHSFIYFRKKGEFTHLGNGFQWDEKAMSQATFDAHVTSSGVAQNCKQATVKRNLYGTSLEECRVGTDPAEFRSGSWMNDGKCTEQTGGVHQICIENLPADFSEQTHQSAWSQARAGKRHCVCVGAWSLYMTDERKHQSNAKAIMPHCKSIPETAMTEHYLQHWKSWNGFPADVIKGVRELVTRCLLQVAQDNHSLMLQCGLKSRFEAMEKKVPELASAPDLASLRAELASLRCPTEA